MSTKEDESCEACGSTEAVCYGYRWQAKGRARGGCCQDCCLRGLSQRSSHCQRGVRISQVSDNARPRTRRICVRGWRGRNRPQEGPARHSISGTRLWTMLVLPPRRRESLWGREIYRLRSGRRICWIPIGRIASVHLSSLRAEPWGGSPARLCRDNCLSRSQGRGAACSPRRRLCCRNRCRRTRTHSDSTSQKSEPMLDSGGWCEAAKSLVRREAGIRWDHPRRKEYGHAGPKSSEEGSRRRYRFRRVDIDTQLILPDA